MGNNNLPGLKKISEFLVLGHFNPEIQEIVHLTTSYAQILTDVKDLPGFDFQHYESVISGYKQAGWLVRSQRKEHFNFLEENKKIPVIQSIKEIITAYPELQEEKIQEKVIRKINILIGDKPTENKYFLNELTFSMGILIHKQIPSFLEANLFFLDINILPPDKTDAPVKKNQVLLTGIVYNSNMSLDEDFFNESIRPAIEPQVRAHFKKKIDDLDLEV